jgi:phage host-nuclease inhibitor protein Gam
MNTRTTRRRATTITGREDLENVLGQYATAVIDGDALKAEMERKIAEIRADYEGRAAEIGRRQEDLFADIEAYLLGNPQEIPEGRKSLELLHGTVGFRTGNPTVRLPRGVDEAALCEELRCSGFPEYVRTREEVNREAVLAADDPTRESLAAHGVKVTQTKDRFFVEVKREQPGV